jgi:hypothetical protein
MEPFDDRGLPAHATFKVFRGSLTTWNELFRQAADFASGIGPDRVIGISHSADHSDGVVTVWCRR